MSGVGGGWVFLQGMKQEQNEIGEEVDISAQIKERMEDIPLGWGNYCSFGGWIPTGVQ